MTVNLYDELFTLRNMGDMPEGTEYKDFLNPDSLRVMKDAKAERGIFDGNEKTFQFVRTGYFTVDSKNARTFNRTVSLKDGFKPE